MNLVHNIQYADQIGESWEVEIHYQVSQNPLLHKQHEVPFSK